jgi:VanZ family protein
MIWLPPLVYAAFIFHFSSESQPLPELTASVWDKALHGIEYAGLALLLCRAWRVEGAAWPQAMLLGLILASGYAATDEWHQAFVPLRDANVRDWLADTIGAAAGVALMWLLSPLIDRLDRHTLPQRLS